MSNVAMNEAAIPSSEARSARTGVVIRRVEIAEDDLANRVVQRFIPAVVISGAVHVLVIGFVLLFLTGGEETKANPMDVTTTLVEEASDDDKLSANDTIGLDPELPAATRAEREDIVNVDAKATEEAVSGSAQMLETAPQTAVQGLGFEGSAGVNGPTGDTGATNGDGNGSSHSVAGMLGRGSGETKDRLLKRDGGTREGEAAVWRGLAWLARKQMRDGGWEFDGGHKNDRIAATGMALLPFLAAGETHKRGQLYPSHVKKGIDFLNARLGSGGRFAGASGMYSQAIATIALCEAYGMEKGTDPALGEKAKSAAYFIVNGQGNNGSWGYQVGANGDTSIVGWQIQALQSANLAGILKPADRERVFKKCSEFLTTVSSDSGSKYGYTQAAATSNTLSAVGLLSRYYLGWTPQHPGIRKGVETFIKTQLPPDPVNVRSDIRLPNMYYYYYATQIVHFHEGKEWHEIWNPRMRETLIKSQNVTNDEAVKGSWAPEGGSIGSECGRLGTTALCLLTLEVYYRHLPLYKRDNGGLMELER